MYKGLQKLHSKQNKNSLKTWAIDANRHFSRENVEMASEYQNKMLTTADYQGNTSNLTPVTMAVARKTDGDVVKGTLLLLLGVC